jgi:hypothetical protein
MALIPFKPGESGNPSGRPKDASLRRLARERTAEAIETLVKIMLNEKAASAARVSAATALLDRGWGKPIQPSAFTDVDGNDRPLRDELGPIETARRIAFVLAQGMRALPKEPAELEQANRVAGTRNTDPSESPLDSTTYLESPDDPEEAL